MGNIKHKMYGTPTYKSWAEMKYRCGNKKRKYYVNINYCEEWKYFENFYRDMGDRPKNKTLDRIDNNGNYCKSNCKWSSSKEQNNNRRNNHLFEYNGLSLTLTDWSDKTGIKKSTLAQRIYVYKWSLEKTLQKGGY